MTGNIPRPLTKAPIQLLRDERCQMSFGERAALEGILVQLKPSLSVEIGSAEGGSLVRIAKHSGWVHSFDLTRPNESVASLQNVTLHTGDSHQLLPQWLAVTRRVSFALIDGDHSAEGVNADLTALLDIPGTQRTVILLHDMANPEVRSGIAGLDEHHKVVYSDLDFLAGYEFAEGPFAGQVWGGLGLIVTGDRDTDGYGSKPAQTLYSRRN